MMIAHEQYRPEGAGSVTPMVGLDRAWRWTVRPVVTAARSTDWRPAWAKSEFGMKLWQLSRRIDALGLLPLDGETIARRIRMERDAE
jgi:hypothetical protein